MIRQLNPEDHAAAARIYNHYVATSTATFQTEPVTPDEWAAEATGGEPGRHGAWAIEGATDLARSGMGTPGPAGPDTAASDPARSGTVASDAGRPGAAATVASGTFAGYVLVTPFKSRCAYRDTAEVTVYLAPEHVGRGLGRAALAHVDAHARDAGLHALLAVVCAENDASLAAFERAGYERCALLREVGTKFGRLLDVVYLEKVIGSGP